MNDVASSALTAWSNFYIMTGSSAGALTGLMFVVVTLIDERQRNKEEGIKTFSTPTVVHFCAALLVSAMMSAPWRSLLYPAVLLGLVGLYGTGYVLRILIRQMRLKAYKPDVEDWTWYSIFPMLAYLSIFGGAIALRPSPVGALFVLASGVTLLLFIGIHNAWDIVTFIATGGPEKLEEASKARKSE